MKRQLNKTLVTKAKPDMGQKQKKFADGGGMYLLVAWVGWNSESETGDSLSKYWRYKYRFADKEKTFSIGQYPDLSLDEAREVHQTLRNQLARGIDPMEHKREQLSERRRARSNTFSAIMEAWLPEHQVSVSGATYKRDKSRLEQHAIPVFGDTPIHEIKTLQIVEHMKTVGGTTRGGTRDKVRRLIGQVFDYAVLHEYCNVNPVRFIPRGSFKNTPTKRHAAITRPDEVGEYWHKVNNELSGTFVVRQALKVATLVFLRASEVAKAEWTEFDLEHASWKIPAHRMKNELDDKANSDNDHTVYLSRQVVGILEALKPVTGRRKHVFASPVKPLQPIVPESILKHIRKLGYEGDDLTTHGLRGMAKTMLQERLDMPRMIVEICLDHRVGSEVEQAYDRGQYVRQRRELYQTWADYLDGLVEKGGKE